MRSGVPQAAYPHCGRHARFPIEARSGENHGPIRRRSPDGQIMASTSFWFGMVLAGAPRKFTVAWLAGLLLAVVVSRPGLALESWGVGAAAAEAGAVLEQMNATTVALPPKVQDQVGADIHLLSQSVTGALGRIERQTSPIVDHDIEHDLQFVADILAALNQELAQLGAQQPAELESDRAAQLDRLASAATVRLDQINRMLDHWTETTSDLVITVHQEDGERVVTAIHRSVYEAIRYTSIGLLLLGLLGLGLLLMRTSKEAHQTQRRLVPSALAALLISVFFAGCVVLSLRPGLLVARTAETTGYAEAHPCRRVDTQRGQLATAHDLDDPYILEATKQRMVGTMQDCLEVSSQAAAIAVDRLAFKIAIAAEATPTDEQPPVDEAGRDQLDVDTPPSSVNPEQADSAASGGPSQVTAPAATVAKAAPKAPAEPKRKVYVATRQVNYRAGPGLGSQRLGALEPGDRVEAVGEDQGWTEVLLPDGRLAFVSSQYLAPAP